MHVIKSIVPVVLICLAFVVADADDAAPVEDTRRLDTIHYGIETQVIELLSALRTEKNDQYKADVLKAFDVSTSPKLKAAILDYFGAMEFIDAEDRSAELIQNRDTQPDTLVASAFSYLIAIHSKAALAEAVTILDEDEKRYAQAAIKAIGAAGSDLEAEALRKAYEADGVEPAIKEAIVLALGSMKSGSSYELLSSIASNEESGKTLRMYSCAALGDLGDERAIPVLAGASVALDPNVRAYAIAALGNFTAKDARSAVREGLRDGHVLPRIAAAKAAGKAQDVDSVPFLEFKVSYDPEQAVRIASISALSEIGGARVDAFLVSFLLEAKNSTQYRSAALGAIVAKGSAESRAAALKSFALAQAEKDRAVFTAFARAMTAVDDQNAIPFVELLLGDKDFSMKLGAIAWAERNKAAQLEGIIKVLSETDPNDAVKKRAVQALGRLSS
jgi:HEAT repeat protein